VGNGQPTFTVLWTNRKLSLCLLCFASLAVTPMTAVCEIFNLLHFRLTTQGGGMAQVAQR